MSQRINKHYVSPIDQFLAKFDSTHPKSVSQMTEHQKYQRIYNLRDHAKASEKSCQTLWKDFLDSLE